MCNPISLIMSADSVWTPASDCWNHSHTPIADRAGLPDGLMGDKYARVEVRPRGEVFRDPATNAVLAVDETWEVKLDEAREPAWWSEDRAACVDRAREAAQRWLADFPAWLVPGLVVTGGHGATMTGGHGATMTGGNHATMTGGNHATMTGGDGATMTGGYGAKMTGGDGAKMTGGYGATMTGGNHATIRAGLMSLLSFYWWDGSRRRVAVAYVGEDGIEPNVAYACVGGKIVKAGGAS